jgi:hypothetical protein
MPGHGLGLGADRVGQVPVGYGQRDRERAVRFVAAAAEGEVEEQAGQAALDARPLVGEHPGRLFGQPLVLLPFEHVPHLRVLGEQGVQAVVRDHHRPDRVHGDQRGRAGHRVQGGEFADHVARPAHRDDLVLPVGPHGDLGPPRRDDEGVRGGVALVAQDGPGPEHLVPGRGGERRPFRGVQRVPETAVCGGCPPRLVGPDAAPVVVSDRIDRTGVG